MEALIMIKNFADKDTKTIWERKLVKKFSAIAQLARDKLVMLNNARQWKDLSFPPGNNLHKLKWENNLKGKWAITIHGSYRICFTYLDNYYYDVQIIDYH